MNVADFEIYGDWETGGADLICPTCADRIAIAYGWSLRQAIAAASLHNRTKHHADRYGYACRGVSEVGY